MTFQPVTCLHFSLFAPVNNETSTCVLCHHAIAKTWKMKNWIHFGWANWCPLRTSNVTEPWSMAPILAPHLTCEPDSSQARQKFSREKCETYTANLKSFQGLKPVKSNDSLWRQLLSDDTKSCNSIISSVCKSSSHTHEPENVCVYNCLFRVELTVEVTMQNDLLLFYSKKKENWNSIPMRWPLSSSVANLDSPSKCTGVCI